MGSDLPSVLIAGCGYVGLALSRYLSLQRHSVWVLTRNSNSRDKIQQAGAVPIIADLANPSTLSNISSAGWVISSLTPGRIGTDNAIYIRAARNLIGALESHPPDRLLWISSTDVYGQTTGEWVDEASPPRPASVRSKTLLAAESMVLDSSFPSIVLRLAGIYGPGRAQMFMSRRSSASVQSQSYLNLVHIDDVVGIVQCLLGQGISNEVYLGVDDEPVRGSEFYTWLAEQAGFDLPTDSPKRISRPTGNKRCSNRKIKTLGYGFKYPNYRSGFSELMAEWA